MYCQLTESERYTFSLLKRQGPSYRLIAFILGRASSTIRRELRRNACHTTNGAYWPSKAQERSNGRRRRSCRAKHHGAGVYEEVETLLREAQWSPEQIAHWCALNGVASISHMTIYRHVYEDTRRGGVLRSCLRQGGKRRRKQTFGPEERGKPQGKPMIDSRPQSVEARDEPGHREGDTVMGAAHERDCLLTLVERSSGMALVVKLAHRTVTAVNRAVVKIIRESGLSFKTITWDNDTEFHGYQQIEQATGARCYFAYPHHRWQRGSNENFNGLLRQYCPKRRSLARLRQRDCDLIAHKLNARPRKRFGYETPIERIKALCAVLHLGC